MESISSPEDDRRQVRGKTVWKSGTGGKKKNYQIMVNVHFLKRQIQMALKQMRRHSILFTTTEMESVAKYPFNLSNCQTSKS